MTAPTGSIDSTVYTTLQQRLLAFLCCLVAMATAVLLWGVGAEAVHFGHKLSGSLLLIDATLMTVLEAVTVCFLLLPRNSCIRCRRIECLSTGLDTYKRSILYALLTATCFVRLDEFWMPAVPGSALILSSVMYMLKHCCNRKATIDVGKMPSFFSFERAASLTPESAVPPTDTSSQQLRQPPTAKPLGLDNKKQQQQLQPPPPLYTPTVHSAVNDYWRDPDVSNVAPVPAVPIIQQPPALPPRRSRQNRVLLNSSVAASDQQNHWCKKLDDI
ncbi:hypothetical protein BOX15_Mlig029807g1 [Macrostomum lignano]|uniref:Transmembrane protein 72 n=2 Tax=Macrostomum lignano TaxID=282301 RepID=A0A1I8G7F8_9PLAT|nr:hypothetical protein BOX15_Mlig029807g1 [Macrostomum lignano]